MGFRFKGQILDERLVKGLSERVGDWVGGKFEERLGGRSVELKKALFTLKNSNLNRKEDIK